MPVSVTLKPHAQLGRRHAHDHATVFGELDGVAQQVAQDLSHVNEVAAHHIGQCRVEVHRQVQAAPLGVVAVALDDAEHRIAQAKRRVHHAQRAGVDVLGIEHVVDHAGERARRLADQRHEALLARIEPRAVQQLGQAHHRVQRRAQFVAHQREKLRLGPTALVAGLACRLQLAVALRDRLRQAVEAVVEDGDLAAATGRQARVQVLLAPPHLVHHAHRARQRPHHPALQRRGQQQQHDGDDQRAGDKQAPEQLQHARAPAPRTTRRRRWPAARSRRPPPRHTGCGRADRASWRAPRCTRRAGTRQNNPLTRSQKRHERTTWDVQPPPSGLLRHRHVTRA